METIDRLEPTSKQNRRDRAIAKRRSEIAPLSLFPQEWQDRIAEQVVVLNPPERWILVGDPSCGQPMGAIPSRAWYEWHWGRGINPVTHSLCNMKKGANY